MELAEVGYFSTLSNRKNAICFSHGHKHFPKLYVFNNSGLLCAKRSVDANISRFLCENSNFFRFILVWPIWQNLQAKNVQDTVFTFLGDFRAQQVAEIKFDKA